MVNLIIQKLYLEKSTLIVILKVRLNARKQRIRSQSESLIQKCNIGSFTLIGVLTKGTSFTYTQTLLLRNCLSKSSLKGNSVARFELEPQYKVG